MSWTYPLNPKNAGESNLWRGLRLFRRPRLGEGIETTPILETGRRRFLRLRRWYLLGPREIGTTGGGVALARRLIATAGTRRLAARRPLEGSRDQEGTMGVMIGEEGVHGEGLDLTIEGELNTTLLLC